MKDIEEIYLRDKLADLAGEAERAVAEAVLEIQSKANKAGALGSGMCKMLIERAVLDGFKSHLHNVSRFLIELDINRTDAAKTAFLNSASAFGDTLIATYQYQLFGNSSFDGPKITDEAVRRKSLTSKFADTAWLIMADMEQNVVDKELVMTDAGRRAAELRNDLSPLNIHPDVLRFCSENYFQTIIFTLFLKQLRVWLKNCGKRPD